MNGLHARYSPEEMVRVWDENSRLNWWLLLETSALRARAEAGEIPMRAVELIMRHAKISVARMKEIEKEMRHDVIAFVKMVQESLKGTEAEPYASELHKLLTSYDIVDPATVLQLFEATRMVCTALEKTIQVMRKRAVEHRWSLMIAFTHGQYAEPTTFGHLLLVYATQLERSLRRLNDAIRLELTEGKMSGAVGNYAGPSPELERRALEMVGLKPAIAETQILQRDRFAAVLTSLAILARSIEQIARTFHGMMRSNVRELEEPRSPNQRGSSRMAYKKNPILTEQVWGLVRLIQADAGVAMEDIPTLDFRTIEQSCAERHIFPRATTYTYYLVIKLGELMEGLVVRPKRMLRNLKATQDVWAANPVRDALMEATVSYDDAYEYTQRLGFQASEEERPLLELLQTERITQIDPRTAQDVLGAERLSGFFDARAYVERGINEMFSRAGL